MTPKVELQLGQLQPSPQGEADQARLLDSLAKQVEASEAYQDQADAYFMVVTRNSELFYKLLAETDKFYERPGVKIEGPTLDAFVLQKRQVRWSFNGGRVRYEIRRLPLDKGSQAKAQDQLTQDQHIIFAYDGSSTYTYMPDSHTGSIETGLSSRSAMIEESWMTLTTPDNNTLSELLRTKGARYEGRQTVGNTECLKVTLPFGSGLDEVWISPTNGYRAKCKVYSRQPESEGEFGSYNITMIDEFRQYGDLWFPIKGTIIRWRLSKSGNKDWLTYKEWSVVDVKPDVPDRLFQLDFPLGTKVSDFAAKPIRSYVVGEAPEESGTKE